MKIACPTTGQVNDCLTSAVTCLIVKQEVPAGNAFTALLQIYWHYVAEQLWQSVASLSQSLIGSQYAGHLEFSLYYQAHELSMLFSVLSVQHLFSLSDITFCFQVNTLSVLYIKLASFSRWQCNLYSVNFVCLRCRDIGIRQTDFPVGWQTKN